MGDKLKLIFSLYLVIPLVLWGFSLQLNQSLSTYGLRLDGEGGLQILAGLGLGLAGLAVLFAVQIGLGWLKWQPTHLTWQAILVPLLIGLFVAAVEEWMFRGFMVTTLLPLGLWAAAVASSLIFAASHLIWQLDDLSAAASELPGLWLMGMVLVLACTLSDGSIHLAWGLHAGWVWGITVVDSNALITNTGKASEWLTGLRGKPLAGVMGLLFLAATAAMLIALDTPA